MKQLPPPLYQTEYGSAYVGDSRELVEGLPDKSINLVLTSPPFALQRQKEYGNVDQEDYVDWLLTFVDGVHRVLTDDGSFVVDLGGAYQRGRPVRSLHAFKFLVRMCEEKDWKLAEDFYWYNPSKLPSPIEWVNKRKIRAKDAVNNVWWFSKTDYPKADVSRVLAPYSERMKLLLKDSKKFYAPKKRPSGHDIGENFDKDNGGAIPSNLLQISNSESNSQYLRYCKQLNINGHPARFPEKLPSFFIDFLTNPGDLVLDIFGGSNTTGSAAERMRRRWITFELDRDYLVASAFRFMDDSNEQRVQELYEGLMKPDASVKLTRGKQTTLELEDTRGEAVLDEKT